MSNLYAELTRITRDVYFGKYYEPVKRNKDGMRWIRHRFPIKGGISWIAVDAIEGRERMERILHRMTGTAK